MKPSTSFDNKILPCLNVSNRRQYPKPWRQKTEERIMEEDYIQLKLPEIRLMNRSHNNSNNKSYLLGRKYMENNPSNFPKRIYNMLQNCKDFILPDETNSRIDHYPMFSIFDIPMSAIRLEAIKKSKKNQNENIDSARNVREFYKRLNTLACSKLRINCNYSPSIIPKNLINSNIINKSNLVSEEKKLPFKSFYLDYPKKRGQISANVLKRNHQIENFSLNFGLIKYIMHCSSEKNTN